MSKIKIEIKGTGAELVLGNYMPKDPTIYNNWEEFYHYNDLIHESQLLSEYISEITIWEDEEQIYTGPLKTTQLRAEKSFCPSMEQDNIYLRTECVENAVYSAEFETESFELSQLFFLTQDYDLLFKVGKSFIVNALYQGKKIDLTWESGIPVGNICLLCRSDNGYLIPVHDLINKKKSV